MIQPTGFTQIHTTHWKRIVTNTAAVRPRLLGIWLWHLQTGLTVRTSRYSVHCIHILSSRIRSFEKGTNPDEYAKVIIALLARHKFLFISSPKATRLTSSPFNRWYNSLLRIVENSRQNADSDSRTYDTRFGRVLVLCLCPYISFLGGHRVSTIVLLKPRITTTQFCFHHESNTNEIFLCHLVCPRCSGMHSLCECSSYYHKSEAPRRS